MAQQGIVRYHQQDSTLTFRVEGRGTMTHGLPLRKHTERCLESGTTCVQVDLHDCTYMDSTFLGTLLTLKKTLDKRVDGRLRLLAPSLSCLRILHQMGLGDMLPAETGTALPASGWAELQCQPDDLHSTKRNIAQAHEELAALPGPAGAQFRQVKETMAAAEKSSPAAPPPSSRPAE